MTSSRHPSPSSRCSPPANGTTPPGAGWTPRGRPRALYFAAWMCVGHFLFLDVLLAMLAFNFARETSDERREREARDAAGVGPGARDALGDAGADGSEADARPRGVLDAAGGEVVAARMRRRGAREFAKEVSRMKTWLRQTDQAHFDDSGGEEEDPGGAASAGREESRGELFGGVLGAFGGDAEDFKTSKRSRGGSRTPRRKYKRWTTATTAVCSPHSTSCPSVTRGATRAPRRL